MKKTIINGFFILIFLFVIFFSWSLFSSIHVAKEEFIYIDKTEQPSATLTSIKQQLSWNQSFAFGLLSKIGGLENHLRGGRYQIKDISAFRLFRNLRNGKQSPVHFVVPIVRTIEDLSGKLGKKFEADSLSFLTVLRSPLCAEQVGKTPQNVIELFIPNTYDVYWNITPQKLLQKMKEESDEFWNGERLSKIKKDGITPDQAMIIASIVEQETANNGEKPMIAGMYINRLRKGMKLQADPTLKFAAKQFALRRISGDILRIDSPYNTYKYAGLPPGPICIPSLASIEAVINFVHHNYLYMCAKEDFSGTHNFAKTYAEHMQNARKYSQALNQKGIK